MSSRCLRDSQRTGLVLSARAPKAASGPQERWMMRTNLSTDLAANAEVRLEAGLPNHQSVILGPRRKGVLSRKTQLFL